MLELEHRAGLPRPLDTS